jgi:hypothetical protein
VRRGIAICSTVLVANLVCAKTVFAQGVDFTFFLGKAFPVYDERLTLRASVPSLPGLEVTSSDALEIRTDGGPVFGGAVAFEFGVLAIEGRMDATEIGFDLSAARFDLRATQPPFTGLTGSLTVGPGRFDVDRLYLLSGNLRLRTPGPLGLVASGGVSLLPDISITGTVPLSVQIAGIPHVPGLEPRVRLVAAPGESEHRVGLNGGVGLRIGGRVALMGEARVFYFREHELRFDIDGAPEFVEAFLDSLDTVRFEPIIVNAQVGLVVKF